MSWVMLWAGLAVTGLAVLGLCAIKVFRAVRELGSELQRARARLAPEHTGIGPALDRLGRTRE